MIADAGSMANARLQQIQSTLESRLQAISQSTGHEFSLIFRRSVSRANTPAAPAVSSDAPKQALPASGDTDIDELISESSARYDVDPALIGALMWAESGFRADAVSPKGAMGLMQLMPSTAEGLGVRDPFDPAQNVDGGVRLLSALLERFGGDQKLAVAAYNMGAAGVERRGVTDLSDEGQFALLPAETRNHLRRIDDYMRRVYQSRLA